MTPTAAELHRRAVEQSIRGRFALAERTLRRAEAIVTDADLRARIKGTQAFIMLRTGRPAEADLLCRTAMEEHGIADGVRAILLGQLGAIAHGSGRLREAEHHFDAAIARLASDPVAEARVRMNRSLHRLQLRNAEGASEDLRRALEIFHDAGLTVDEAQARHNLAYVALLRGDLVAALRGMQEARPLAAASPSAAAICDMDRAEVLSDAGLAREAEQVLTAAAREFGRHGMPQFRGEAELELAHSQLFHDPQRAARSAAEAERRFMALESRIWATRATAVRMRAELAGGRVRRGGGRVTDPRIVSTPDEVESVVSTLEEAGVADEAAALRLALAVWRARHGQVHDIGAIRAPRGANLRVQLLAYEARVARATARGAQARARRAAADGLEVLAGWRESFGSLDLQTSVAMHGRDLVFAGLTSAIASRRLSVVFEWSERAREVSQQVVPLRPPPDPELAAELAELRMLRAEDPNWATTPRSIALRESVRARQWVHTGASAVRRRISIDELAHVLDERTALMSFVYSGDALVCLVVTRDDRRIVDVPEIDVVRQLLTGLRGDLDMVATVRTGPLAGVVRRSLDARLAALSTALLEEPLHVAGDCRVVITVPGLLAGIPWAMLPGMRGRPLTLASSATQWADVQEKSWSLYTAGFAAGPRVARASEEVHAAAASWPSPILLEQDAATVDAVTSLASRVDVLHLASHGQHAADNALFSGVELGDGTLFGYDIDRIPDVPEVVVLSACEGGRSSVRWGEEAIGMARIWLAAGARCVIATPVVVADDDACELLGAFHNELAAGRPPAEALAAASTRTGLVTPFQAHGAGF